jgi:hypothetical protein
MGVRVERGDEPQPFSAAHRQNSDAARPEVPVGSGMTAPMESTAVMTTGADHGATMSVVALGETMTGAGAAVMMTGADHGVMMLGEAPGGTMISEDSAGAAPRSAPVRIGAAPVRPSPPSTRRSPAVSSIVTSPMS